MEGSSVALPAARRCCDHHSKCTSLHILSCHCGHKQSLVSPALVSWFVVAELHLACSITSAVLTWARSYISVKLAVRRAMKFLLTSMLRSVLTLWHLLKERPYLILYKICFIEVSVHAGTDRHCSHTAPELCSAGPQIFQSDTGSLF